MTADILVIGRHDDSHVALSVSAIERTGRTCDHLRLGLPRSRYQVRCDLRSTALGLDGRDYFTAGYRHILHLPMAVNRPPLVDGEGDLFSEREWNALLRSVLAGWFARDPAVWLIRPDADLLQDRKVALLQCAAGAGGALGVPRTVVSNRLTPADQDFLGQRIVVKAINAWQEIGPGRHFNTTMLTARTLTQVTGTAALATPTIFQTFIEHSLEYRCYCVDGALLALRLELAPTVVDSRLPGAVLSAQVADRGPEFGPRLAEITRQLGLRYCCFDVAVDRSGGAWLTDINPIGSWNYLKNDFGVDLTPWIIEHWLTGGTDA